MYILVRKALWGQRVLGSVADPEGRRVGVAGGEGSVDDSFVIRALQKAGLAAKVLEIVNFAKAELPLGLEKSAGVKALGP